LNENLLYVWLGCARDASDRIGRQRRISPAENSEAFFAYNPLEDPLANKALMTFYGQENHAGAILSRQGQRKTQPSAFVLEERVRDLDHNPGTVAGYGIAPARTPVLQIHQYLDALEDDVVRGPALDMGDKANPTGIPLKSRIVEALPGWIPLHIVSSFPAAISVTGILILSGNKGA